MATEEQTQDEVADAKNQEALEGLWHVTIKALTDAISNPGEADRAQAARLEVARKILRDNGIEIEGLRQRKRLSGRLHPKEALPFPEAQSSQAEDAT